MNKKRRNTIISTVAIVLVLAASGAAVINMYGFDNLIAMFTSLFSSSSGDPGPSNNLGYYDENYIIESSSNGEVGFEVSKQGLSFSVTDVEIDKELGSLNLEQINSAKYWSGDFSPSYLKLDSSGNILSNHSFIKIHIKVQNLYDHLAVGFLNNDNLLYTRLLTMTGENEFPEEEDPSSTFFIRKFEPGETREFILGYVVRDDYLKKDNQFLYGVSPTMMNDFYLHMEYPDEYVDYSSDVDFVTDSTFRYIDLKPFIEEWLK